MWGDVIAMGGQWATNGQKKTPVFREICNRIALVRNLILIVAQKPQSWSINHVVSLQDKFTSLAVIIFIIVSSLSPSSSSTSSPMYKSSSPSSSWNMFTFHNYQRCNNRHGNHYGQIFVIVCFCVNTWIKNAASPSWHFQETLFWRGDGSCAHHIDTHWHFRILQTLRKEEVHMWQKQAAGLNLSEKSPSGDDVFESSPRICKFLMVFNWPNEL